MTVTIKLTGEREETARAAAERAGQELGEYVQSLVDASLSNAVVKPLAPAEFQRRIRELPKTYPPAPVLTDEQLSRESIYADDRN